SHHLVLELVRHLPSGRVLLVHEADDNVAVRLHRAVGEEALVTDARRTDPLMGRTVGRIRTRDLDRPRPVLAGVIGVGQLDRRAQERPLALLDPIPTQIETRSAARTGSYPRPTTPCPGTHRSPTARSKPARRRP